MPSKEEIIEVLKQVKDLELDIDIWTLGLIYEIKADAKPIHILMTLTTPFCPHGGEMIDDAKQKLHDAFKVDVEIEVTFEPAWQPSDDLREAMGI